MSDQTTSTNEGQTIHRREVPAPERVTIIKERSSGAGIGLIGVLLVIAVLAGVAILWAGRQSDTDQAITNAADAVTNASNAVGDAAGKVGAAADKAADEAEKTAGGGQ